tara:strand:- start:190 stop:3750 length:3561 start_codon:yes stop_codon:yes gene_type:complete
MAVIDYAKLEQEMNALSPSSQPVTSTVPTTVAPSTAPKPASAGAIDYTKLEQELAGAPSTNSADLAGITYVEDLVDTYQIGPKSVAEQTEEAVPVSPERAKDNDVQAQYEKDLNKLSTYFESGKKTDSLWLDPTNGILDRWIEDDGKAKVASRDRNSKEWSLESLQRTRDEVDEFLDSPNFLRSNMTKGLLATGMPLPKVAMTVNAMDFSPFYGTASGIIDMPENLTLAGGLWEKDQKLFASGVVALSALEIAASLVGARGIVRTWKEGTLKAGQAAAKAGEASSTVIRGPNSRTTIDINQPDENIVSAVNANGKVDVAAAKAAEQANTAVRLAEASKVAEANDDIAQQLISEFEERTNKIISDTIDGKKVLNFDLARKAGNETAQKILKTQTADQTTTNSLSELALLATGSEDLVEPFLKPEKFNSIVALASDLRAKDPEYFNKLGPDGKKMRVVDLLFEASVKKDMVAPQDLVDMLAKYDLSFEDYVLTVVGSGSKAGEVFQKLSQVRRIRPADSISDIEEKARREAQSNVMKGFLRLEGIRRGLLVSKLATASRNLTSAGIRAPLEGLGNVMDTAMYNIGKKGVVVGVKSLGDLNNWRGSFSHMGYMFQPGKAKGLTDLILNRPETMDILSSLFDNLNGIQKASGRGKGGAVDWILSRGEDITNLLNTPNRWQEHLVRRGSFLGELERLAKREWDVDLIDVIQKGEIRDLLNDTSKYKPKDGRSFMDMVADSTKKALDITYAKAPDVQVFRETSNFITRNGLTVVLPFPRFMFNSMELMGQYGAGASIPLTKAVTNFVTGGKAYKGQVFTAKDRQRVSRNILGMVAVGAAYQYRTSEDATADYKKMNTGDGTSMDMTPQFPMRQFLFMGEAAKRIINGTFDDWFDAKEFTETFVGTNIRTGVGEGIVQEVADLATGVDLTSGESVGKTLGKAFGNYLSTWVVPYGQIIDAQRGLGIRGTGYKESAGDPNLDFGSSLKTAFTQPFRSQSVGLSAEEEAALPEKQYVLTEKKKRIAPFAKLLFGLSMTTTESDEGEYIVNLGYTEFNIASRSKIPSVRNFENEMLRKFLPAIVDGAKKREQKLRMKYTNLPDTSKIKEIQTEEEYVNSFIKKQVDDGLAMVRSKLADGKLTQASPIARAITDYRALPTNVRSMANTIFIEKTNREPDATNLEDLRRLVLIGKRIK